MVLGLSTVVLLDVAVVGCCGTCDGGGIDGGGGGGGGGVGGMKSSTELTNGPRTLSSPLPPDQK